MSSNDREAHVKKIISQPLEVIESEHGLAGLDHVADIVQERRKSMIFELEQQREKGNT